MQIENPTYNNLNSLIDSAESLPNQELLHFEIILKHIEKCGREQNIDKKIQILRF
jgi:hypothetical protein